MTIKIGHSSIDENGNAIGGAAGDQTQKEVCTRTYYKASWDAVLRPKTTKLAEKSAKFIEQACANDNIGYDQGQRNTLYTQAVSVGYDASKIKTKCECDCSSLVHVAAMAGGAKLTYGSNGFTTRTMVDKLVESGDYEKLTDSKYLTSDKYLKRGDILVNVGSHTVMVLENGSGVATTQPTTNASSSATSSTYYPKYTGTSSSLDAILEAIGVPAEYRGGYKRRIPLAEAQGITGYEGNEEQNSKLKSLARSGKLKKVGATAITTTYTKTQFIKDVQHAIGAKVDGIADDDTLAKTITVSKVKNATHAVVLPIQKYLSALGYNCGTADGKAGEQFEKAVIAYQKATGCTADGEITAKNKTWKMLLGIISTTVQKDTTIKVGSKVKVTKGAKWYNGATPKSFVYSNVYDVLKVDGEKVRIGKGKAITGTIHRDNLIVQ